MHPDEDIKVFYPSGDKEKNSEKDVLSIAHALDVQRSNGNLALAKKLGKQLSSVTPENAGEFDGIDLEAEGLDTDITALNSGTLYQCRVLMLFTAQITLHSVLPPIISSEAVNSMYDSLRENSEPFYDNVMDGTSFSFYYLAIRKGFNIDENIGRNFAMLCGDEDDDELSTLGRKIFTATGKYVKSLIKSFDFKL